MERGKEIIELVSRLTELIIEEGASMKDEIQSLSSEVAALRSELAELKVAQSVSEETHPEEQPDDWQPVETQPEETHPEETRPEETLVVETVVEEPEPEPEPEPAPEPESEPEPEPDEPSVEEVIMMEKSGDDGVLLYESDDTAAAGEPDDDPVLMPRSRAEQEADGSDFGGDASIFGELDTEVPQRQDSIRNDVPPSRNFWDMDDEENVKDPAWMTDVPGSRVESVFEAVSASDRILFINELFDGDAEQYESTMKRIDDSASFIEVVSEMRPAFPMWRESSDTVYQFYMAIRRKFRV